MFPRKFYSALVSVSLCVYLLTIVCAYAERSEAGIYKQKLQPIVTEGNYSYIYEYSVNSTVEYIFEFVSSDVSPTAPARITVECEGCWENQSYPVLVVVRQKRGVLSWQLPLRVESESSLFVYMNTSRTLCPHSNYYSPQGQPHSDNEVIVSLSSASPENIKFSLVVNLEKHFMLSLSEKRNVSVSPSTPCYFGFKFTADGPDSLLLRVDSEDDICMTVSVQNMSCPVFDLEPNVKFEGYWQTVDRRGGITLTRRKFPLGFYVVLVVMGEDCDCSGSCETRIGARNKSVVLSLTPTITYDDYIVPTVAAVAVFFLFYIFSFLMSLLYFIRRRRFVPEQELLDDSSSIASPYCASPPPRTYEQIQSPASTSASLPIRRSSDSSLDETDYDTLHDADSDKNIFRTKAYLSVDDLARKDPRILRKKSQLYVWNLLTVAVFYALPVVQLVITYQRILNTTGDQDSCYYNFLCSHPLGIVSDFNHVFSNLGYVLLGLLFILLTYRRDVMHSQAGVVQDKYYGIPQHYGLFYAMGAALMMEGLLSACYHFCPNQSNFQFDTSFMYVISMLCMLKIYHTRHPDVNASAYATFGVLAIVIFVGMCGVLGGTLYFWVGFTVVHLVTCVLLSAQIYYMGRWKLDRGICKRVLSLLCHDFRASPLSCIRPIYPNRMVLLILGNACNWMLAIFGLMYNLHNFATYFLAIFIANLLLYCLFYIAMKLCYREKIPPQPRIYILLSFLSWGAALYFFFDKSISWSLTPARSKAYNQQCLLLDFYDKHDIWHFLSATSMFFSFMVLLTLDDDLTNVLRTQIPVF